MNAPLPVEPRKSYSPRVCPPISPEEEDAALARRIVGCAPERDVAAEAELCRRFASRIRLFALKRLRSDAAAADLAQDVLMLTLQKLRSGEVREPERIGAFVLGIARQTMIDSSRNSARRERLLETFPADLSPVEDEPREILDTDRLHHCMQALVERERAVLLMTFYDDRSAEAVGAELGISAANVRVIRHRGIRHLRDCMNLAEVAS